MGRPMGSKNDSAKAAAKRAALPFRQSELMRGIRAMADMKVPIGSIIIRDGTVTIVPAVPTPPPRIDRRLRRAKVEA
jgi:hypothetical protein